MMSLTFGLFTQVSGSGPLGPLVLLAVPRRLFCFGSLVVLDVVFRYMLLC